MHTSNMHESFSYSNDTIMNMLFLHTCYSDTHAIPTHMLFRHTCYSDTLTNPELHHLKHIAVAGPDPVPSAGLFEDG